MSLSIGIHASEHAECDAAGHYEAVRLLSLDEMLTVAIVSDCESLIIRI